MFKILLDQSVALLDGLPKWVRITFVFVLLFLVVYMLLSPKVIFGNVRARIDDGMIKVPGVELSTQIFGHFHKVVSDEEGIWVMPIPSAWPKSIEIEVVLPEVSYFRTFQLNPWDFWIYDRVIVLIEGNAVKEIQLAGSPLPGMSLLGGIGRTAVAGELKLRSEVPAAPTGSVALANSDDQPVLPPAAMNRIRQQTADILGKVSKGRPAQIGSDFDLYEGFTFVDRVLVYDLVGRVFDIYIPTNHRQGLRTKAQLDDYIAKRVILADQHNAFKAIQSDTDWYRAVSKIPVEQRPQFVPRR